MVTDKWDDPEEVEAERMRQSVSEMVSTSLMDNVPAVRSLSPHPYFQDPWESDTKSIRAEARTICSSSLCLTRNSSPAKRFHRSPTT
jgi:hypothetical protein